MAVPCRLTAYALAAAALTACGSGAGAAGRPSVATGPPLASTSSSTTPSSSTTIATSSTATSTALAPTDPATTSTTIPVPDRRVFLLGDSVMAALNPTYTDLARHTLEPLGWTVTIDAKESRFPSAAIEVLKARRAEIGDVVVIHMSNNYLDDEALWAQQIDDMFATLTGVKRFIFINVSEFRPDRAQVNEQLRAALVRHPNMVLLDWNALTKANPSYTGSDHLHLSLAGARAYAAMIADGLGPVRLPPTPAAAHSLLRRS